MQSAVWNIMKLFNLLIYYSNNKIDQLYLRLNKKVKSVMSYTPKHNRDICKILYIFQHGDKVCHAPWGLISISQELPILHLSYNVLRIFSYRKWMFRHRHGTVNFVKLQSNRELILGQFLSATKLLLTNRVPRQQLSSSSAF